MPSKNVSLKFGFYYSDLCKSVIADEWN
jgi:hypothetical protein